MSDELILDEPVIIPPIELEPIALSDGTEIEVKPIPGTGAEYVDYRRKTGYTGDCTLKLTVTEGQDPLEIAEGIKAALEIELISKTKYDYTLTDVVSAHKARINATCQSTILARFSLIYQANVANGLYPDNGMKAWIAAMVIESNRCHELIDTKLTIEDVLAVTPVWPTFTEVV